MKKFTPLFTVLAFVLLFSYNANATKVLSTPVMISPAANSTIKNYESTKYTFYVTNVGTDTIKTTDSIYAGFGYVNGSQITLTSFIKFVRKTDLAPNDTFNFSWTTGLIVQKPGGTLNLAFIISLTNKIADFKTLVVPYNFNTGLEEYSKIINKIYYSNNNLNITFDSKINTTATLLLTNVSGQIIENRIMNISQGNVHETINLGTLPKGIYILNMKTSYGIDSKKFVVE